MTNPALSAAAPDLDWRTMGYGGFTQHVGPIEIARESETVWRFRLQVGPQHINAGGVCHGGLSLTLLDSGMGSAVWEAGGMRPCATIQLDSHFLAAAKEGQRLEGRAEILRRTEEIAFVEGELFAGGRRTMRASGVWKYLSNGR